MRIVDNKDTTKHIASINKIKHICSASIVAKPGDQVITMRFLINHGSKHIRSCLVIGRNDNGRMFLSQTGLACVNQWLDDYPNMTVVFAEFSAGETGNRKRIRDRLLSILDDAVKNYDTENTLFVLAAKNHTMYDKIGGMIEFTGLHGVCTNE